MSNDILMSEENSHTISLLLNVKEMTTVPRFFLRLDHLFSGKKIITESKVKSLGN